MGTEYAGLACHCTADEAGHQPGADGCTSTVKAGPSTRFDWPRIKSYGGEGASKPYTGARGTCPVCGKTGVKVRRVEVRTSDRPDVHDLMPGVALGVVLALASHSSPGRGPCPVGGLAPAETRYRCSAIEATVRDYGPDAVDLDGAKIALPAQEGEGAT